MLSKVLNLIPLLISSVSTIVACLLQQTKLLHLLSFVWSIKNTTSVDLNDIQFALLPQSKLYLKTLGISYLIKDTNISIDLSVVESIIKSTYIFDNIHIVSKLHIIKVLPKSDMAIVWINI